MPWKTDVTGLNVIPELLSLRMRAARLELYNKIRIAEQQAQAAGISLEPLQRVKQALARQPLDLRSLAADEPTLTVPAVNRTRPPGAPLRHLAVRLYKENKF